VGTTVSELDAILMNPTQCYVPGCERENELLLHLAGGTDDSWRGSDMCLPHARSAIANTPLIWTCECTFCQRARQVASAHEHAPGVVVCADCLGVWMVRTASGSTHRLDLDAKTVQRIQDSTRATLSRTQMWSQPLRRDGGPLPLLRLDPVRIGQRATWVLGQVDDYPGYVSTTRQTTPVVTVEPIPDNSNDGVRDDGAADDEAADE